jgi:S1-C subfamily serine protease
MVGRVLLILCAMCLSSDWPLAAGKLSKSVVYIENAHGSCTGFVINADVKKEKEPDRDYILTAAHCEGDDLYADQTVAKVIWKDTKKDLMVLAVEDLGRPALKLAKDNPKIGDEVASLGYGWGLERPMFRTAHVSDDDTYIPEDGIGGPLIVIDAQFVSGQSGGPVINAAGEVALIVQRGGQGVGIGVGAETIRSKTGKYWEKPKP